MASGDEIPDPDREARDARVARVRGSVEANDAEIVEFWRGASQAQRGRTLWGLLEFAEMVQRGKAGIPEPEPMKSLPSPIGERENR